MIFSVCSPIIKSKKLKTYEAFVLPHIWVIILLFDASILSPQMSQWSFTIRAIFIKRLRSPDVFRILVTPVFYFQSKLTFSYCLKFVRSSKDHLYCALAPDIFKRQEKDLCLKKLYSAFCVLTVCLK